MNEWKKRRVGLKSELTGCELVEVLLNALRDSQSLIAKRSAVLLSNGCRILMGSFLIASSDFMWQVDKDMT